MVSRYRSLTRPLPARRIRQGWRFQPLAGILPSQAGRCWACIPPRSWPGV